MGRPSPTTSRRAGDHDVEPVAGVALAEDRLAGGHHDVVELAGDRLEGGQREGVEQRDPPQQGQLVVAAHDDGVQGAQPAPRERDRRRGEQAEHDQGGAAGRGRP